MKDLDFDELDRAVNSLMSNVPKSAPQTTTTNEKTLDLGSSLAGDSQAIPAKLEDMAKKAAEQEAPAAMPTPSTPTPTVVAMPRPAAPAVKTPDRPQSSAPAVRRGGRFMDVVHPSSDMKKPEAPRSVSRQGITIEPMGKAAPGEPVVQPKSFAPAPVMPEKEPTADTKPVVDEAPKPLEPPKIEPTTKDIETPESSTPSSDWPDPLDMATKNEATQAPLTSPFLADAKVEKRPLGGLSTPDMMDDKKPEPTEESEPATTTPSAEVIESPKPEETKTVAEPELPSSAALPIKTPTMPSTENLVAPLPEELQGDLMAVEADTTHDEMKQQHDSVTQQEQSAQEDTQPTTVEVPKHEPKSEPPVPAGPTSIPQQYHEEPSTGDQDNGAIYDTSTYHQPLAHPAKKKSGWLWIVWIVVILLLGAAGGAAIYFMKLV